MRIVFLLTLSLFVSTSLYSQERIKTPPTLPQPKPIAADCDKAIRLLLSITKSYGPTVAPSGFGEKQEFPLNNSRLFEGEHNSAWYQIVVAETGELGFEIIPQDTTNDYDFVLYRFDSTFCSNKLPSDPLRSNLSNIRKSIKGVTGMRADGAPQKVAKGIGQPFSKTLKVNKGEVYMLVLDNVTPGGKGHTIKFFSYQEVVLKGRLLDSDSVPVIADVTISDARGEVVASTTSNAKGDYEIKTSLQTAQNYNLTAISDSTFVQTKVVNTNEIKDGKTYPDIKMVLPKLKAGSKYTLGNINFVGNQAVLLDWSLPTIEALYKLMQKNKKMVIEIEGHTNGQFWNQAKNQRDEFEQKLSVQRARLIYNYLIQKGISEKRVTTVGYGSLYPLFKQPKDEKQAMQNRRVEIKVVSLR